MITLVIGPIALASITLSRARRTSKKRLLGFTLYLTDYTEFEREILIQNKRVDKMVKVKIRNKNYLKK